jgi:hemerythrin
MAFLEWRQEWTVGVEELDRQHKRLIEVLNRLHDAMTLGTPRDAVARTVSDLISYTRYHFVREEDSMRVHGYPAYAEHKRQHDDFANMVLRFEEDLQSGRIALSVPLMQFLKTWLKEHIAGSDQAYSACLSGPAALKRPLAEVR